MCSFDSSAKSFRERFKNLSLKICKLLYKCNFLSKILFLVIKIFWKDGVQVWLPAERMFVKSLKTCHPESENIYERKDGFKLEIFPGINFFGHAELSFHNLAVIF